MSGWTRASLARSWAPVEPTGSCAPAVGGPSAPRGPHSPAAEGLHQPGGREPNVAAGSSLRAAPGADEDLRPLRSARQPGDPGAAASFRPGAG